MRLQQTLQLEHRNRKKPTMLTFFFWIGKWDGGEFWVRMHLFLDWIHCDTEYFESICDDGVADTMHGRVHKSKWVIRRCISGTSINFSL